MRTGGLPPRDRPAGHGRLQGNVGRHAALHHELELARVVTVWADACVGAERNRHAHAISASKGVHDLGAHRNGLGSNDGGVVTVDQRLFAYKTPGAECGHVPRAFLFHQTHGRLAHEGAVLDAGHATLDGAAHAHIAVCMRGHGVAVIFGGIDDGADFFHGELRCIGAARVAEHAARGGDLDGVGAFFVALAHGPAAPRRGR